MRGPGNTPGAWGMEMAIDELAERLRLDPLALRERIDPSPVRREERRVGAEKIGWARRHAPGADPGPIKRGMGVAQSLWGANVQTASSIEVRILRDGSVEALSSVQDRTPDASGHNRAAPAPHAPILLAFLAFVRYCPRQRVTIK